LPTLFTGKEFAPMAKGNARDQIIVRISMVNGVPSVRPLTEKEQRQFIKTHPKSKLPVISLEKLSRLADSLEDMTQIVDPSTISVANAPSAT
jgi:hypothetical protein